MADGYLHDIFISYRHTEPALTWVTEYFFPLLKKWLPEFMPYDYAITEESIFIDQQIETSSSWPIRLTEALRTSRCLLPIWSPSYFRSSDWCKAELHTMLEREKILGMRKDSNSSGLIYPVIFASSHLVPREYSTIQYKDLSKWAIDAPAFKGSPAYIEFTAEVKKICQELQPIIQSAPKWQDNWPVVRPKTEILPDPPFPLTRFS